MVNLLSRLRAWWRGPAPATAAAAPAPKPRGMKVSHETVARAAHVPATTANVFKVWKPAPGVVPNTAGMAMDQGMSELYGWAMQDAYSEGLAFMGYPALAQLTVRPEYRRPAEILATEMTRKWIKFHSTGEGDEKAEKLKVIEAAFEKLKVQSVFKKALELDGFFGRAQIFVNIEGADDAENRMPLAESKDKIGSGALKALTVIEPMWTYPSQYNTIDPLREDYFVPTSWFVQGKEVHSSRLITIITRPVPDILKPAYAFGGLSLVQMLKPYVDNWLDTRQAVADIVQAFTTFVLKTNMGDMLNAGASEGLFNRLDLFNKTRNNRGILSLDKDTEDFANVSAPLGGLDHLQAQTQEHMCLTRGTLIETARGQIPIEYVAVNDMVMTRNGYAPVAWAGITKYTSELTEVVAGGSILHSTPEHPIWSETSNSFVAALNVNRFHLLLKSCAWESTDHLSLGVVGFGARLRLAISETARRAACSIACCTKLMLGLFLREWMFTTLTKIPQTTAWTICGFSVEPNIRMPMSRVALHCRSESVSRVAVWNAQAHLKLHGLIEPCIALAHARLERISGRIQQTQRGYGAEKKRSAHLTRGGDRVAVQSVSRLDLSAPVPVYDITVGQGHLPEFFANGLLVHNSAVSGIPLVHAFGITPTGLNASSDGEIEVFTNAIHAGQESHMRPALQKILNIVQLSEFQEIDPEIGFEFEPLKQLTEAEAATVRKTEAETDGVLIDKGIIDPTEARERLANQPESPYSSLDLNKVIEPPDQGPEGGMPGEGGFPGGPDAAPEDGAPAGPAKPAQPGPDPTELAAHEAPAKAATSTAAAPKAQEK